MLERFGTLYLNLNRALTLNLSLVMILSAGAANADSGLRYGYYKFDASVENYTGLRSKGIKFDVHEFQVSDSSGAFSAALQTTANRTAAEAGAINEENRKVAKGESIGGPKTLNYSYEEAAARQGDSKIYGLKLGSNKSSFSTETLFGDRKVDGHAAFVELSMISPLWNGSVFTSENLGVLWSVLGGFRFGGVKQTEVNAVNQKDKFRDTAYFYVPVTARLIFATPFNLYAGVETGVDPITVGRQKIMKTKIPTDIYSAAYVEYRFKEWLGAGLQFESYRGSSVVGGKEIVKNPVYNHEMAGAYLSFGF